MKIPNEIRIAGVDYKIIDIPGLHNAWTLAYGHVNWENSTIELSSDNQDHQHKSVVLLHEILHTIIWNADYSPKDEEHLVDILAHGLYQVLQDNGNKLFDLVDLDEVEHQIECKRRATCRTQRQESGMAPRIAKEEDLE